MGCRADQPPPHRASRRLKESRRARDAQHKAEKAAREPAKKPSKPAKRTAAALAPATDDLSASGANAAPPAATAPSSVSAATFAAAERAFAAAKEREHAAVLDEQRLASKRKKRHSEADAAPRAHASRIIECVCRELLRTARAYQPAPTASRRASATWPRRPPPTSRRRASRRTPRCRRAPSSASCATGCRSVPRTRPARAAPPATPWDAARDRRWASTRRRGGDAAACNATRSGVEPPLPRLNDVSEPVSRASEHCRP
jgi:hypothetical protein